MLKALLVDDEMNNLSSLEFMLHNDCEGIAVAGKAQNAEDTRNFLSENSVDVLFLDITMPNEDGFQLLETIDTQNLKVIFVTAHDTYMLRAIKASAVDYLLKPVKIDELQNAVEKVKRSFGNPMAAEQNRMLLQHFKDWAKQKNVLRKLAVPQLGSIRFVDLDEIVSLQADNNYTILHLANMQKMVISKTLKDFEELLDNDVFIRIHKSYIINIAFVKEYLSADGGIAIMMDGNRWSISRRQHDIFLEKMKKQTINFRKG